MFLFKYNERTAPNKRPSSSSQNEINSLSAKANHYGKRVSKFDYSVSFHKSQ